MLIFDKFSGLNYINLHEYGTISSSSFHIKIYTKNDVILNFRYIIFLFLSVCIVACSKPAPEGILERKELTAVLVDVHLADAYLLSINDQDSVNRSTVGLYRSLYAKHQTDSVTFRKSLQYYSRDPKLLQSIYDDVAKQLVQLQKQASK